MKESAGAANITVITILLIGLVALAGAILIPRLTKNTAKVSCCTENGGTWSKGKCIEIKGLKYDEEGYKNCIK